MKGFALLLLVLVAICDWHKLRSIDDAQPLADVAPKDAAGPPAPPPASSAPAPAPVKPPSPPIQAASAELLPYNKGGGHHPVAKRAFEGASNYDANKALAIPGTLKRVVGATHSRKNALAKTVALSCTKT